MDNPSSPNVLPVGTNLNAWDKDPATAMAWETKIGDLTREMDQTLELDKRVALFQERGRLMREYLPLTPLVAQSFHFYDDLGNVWPKDKLDSVSIQSPYRPGNFRENVIQPN